MAHIAQPTIVSLINEAAGGDTQAAGVVEITLAEGDTAWNPASPTTRIRAVNRNVGIEYTRHADGGIDARTDGSIS